MRVIRLKKLLALAALASLGAASTADATILLQDNFDSYADQAAFQAAWPAVGTVAPTSASLSSALFVSSPNSVLVPGSATTGQYRNRRSFSESGSVTAGDLQLVWSFDFYDSNAASGPNRNFANLQDTTAPTATNQLIAMGLNNNQTAANSGGNRYMARILGYTVPTTADPDGGPAETVGGSGAFFKLNDFGTPVRSTGWHNLKVVISTNDGNSQDYEFFVDGVLAERVSNIGTAASIRSYDNIALGSGLSNGSQSANFDNVSFTLIPEPATLVLAGMGLAGMVLVARRRAA